MEGQEVKRLTKDELIALGLNLCAGDDKNGAFGVSQEWKDAVIDQVMKMTEKFAKRQTNHTEYVLSMISLGDTENKRLYLATEAGRFMSKLAQLGFVD